MDRRLVGWVLTGAGLVVTLASVFADQLGLGTEDTGVGWKQIVGVVAGIVVAGAGLLMVRLARPSDVSTGS